MDPELLTAPSGSAQRASRPGKRGTCQLRPLSSSLTSRSSRRLRTNPPGARARCRGRGGARLPGRLSEKTCLPFVSSAAARIHPSVGPGFCFHLTAGFYVHRFLRNPRQGDSGGRRAALLGHLVTRSDGRDQARLACSPRAGLGWGVRWTALAQGRCSCRARWQRHCSHHSGFCRGHGRRRGRQTDLAPSPGSAASRAAPPSGQGARPL